MKSIDTTTYNVNDTIFQDIKYTDLEQIYLNARKARLETLEEIISDKNNIKEVYILGTVYPTMFLITIFLIVHTGKYWNMAIKKIEKAIKDNSESEKSDMGLETLNLQKSNILLKLNHWLLILLLAFIGDALFMYFFVNVPYFIIIYFILFTWEKLDRINDIRKVLGARPLDIKENLPKILKLVTNKNILEIIKETFKGKDEK